MIPPDVLFQIGVAMLMVAGVLLLVLLHRAWATSCTVTHTLSVLISRYSD